jgi:hypothetical protein
MKPSLTVTWQSYDSITSDTPGFNLSDLGGPDDIDKDWAAYVAQYATEWHPHLEAIRQSILALRVWAGGDWYQNSAHGVPILSDGHFMVYLAGVGRVAGGSVEYGIEAEVYIHRLLHGRPPT